jgi:hypothetical protein
VDADGIDPDDCAIDLTEDVLGDILKIDIQGTDVLEITLFQSSLQRISH